MADPLHPAPTGEITESDGPTRRVGAATSREATAAVGAPPPQHDRYEIRELIAQGGMGEVHLAWDRELQREVALKTLRVDLDDETLATRFLYEAQLSAQLEHPNIVPVHDFGFSPDGRPFITMRWIRGRSLWELDEDGKLPGLVERLDVFRKVCDAIAFAHAQGVVHRDLKPSNVMVGEFGEVLVLDWGIARLTGTALGGSERGGTTDRLSHELLSSPLTGTGIVIGTPVFMAPELLARTAVGIDPRFDVYALGVMLYKLLTDVLPFSDRQALVEGRAGALVPPRRRRPSIDRELDAIVRKAMAPAPGDRYASAAELRRDVLAYFEGGELVAFPRSPIGRAVRWARHNRRIVAPVLATILLASVALVIGGVLYARELAVSRDQALSAEHEAHAQAARAETAAALTSIEAGRYDEARVALARARNDLAAGDDTAFVDLTEAYLLHEWAPPLLRWQHAERVGGKVGVLLAPDGKRLLFITPEQRAHLISLPDGFAELSADLGGQRLDATGFIAGAPAVAGHDGGAAWLRELGSDRELLRIAGTGARITGIHAGGRVVLATADGHGTEVVDVIADTRRPWPLPADAIIEHVTADGTIATGHRAPANRRPDAYLVWELASGRELARFAGAEQVAMDPTGRWLLIETDEGTELRARASGELHHAWPDMRPHGAAFSADGRELALDHGDGRLTVWSTEPIAPLAEQRFRARLRGIAQSGDLLVTDAVGWSLLARGSPSAGRFRLDGKLVMAASSSDGVLACVASRDGRVRVLEPWTGAVLHTFHGAPAPAGSRGCAFSPRTTLLAQADRDGVLRIWDLDDGSLVRAIAGNELVNAARFVDERRVIASFVGGDVAMWDVHSGARLVEYEGAPQGAWEIDLSRDGKWLLASGRDREDPIATLWSVDGGQPRAQLSDELVGYGARISPDGSMLVVGTHGSRAAWWVGDEHRRIEGLGSDDQPVVAVELSEDGTLVFGSSALGVLDVWRTADGERVASIPLFGADLGELLMLPGTSTLLTIGGDDELRMFDLDRPRVVAESTPPPDAAGFALPSAGERALQLARLSSMRGDWTTAARHFAAAGVAGTPANPIEHARAAWQSGDRALARRLLREAVDAGAITAGSAAVWASAQ